MPETLVPLIAGDFTDNKVEYRTALPVNMYAVPHSVLGTKGYMTTHPGLELLVASQGADRGAFYNDRLGAHLRVSGGKLIELSAFGSVTVLGDIPGGQQCTLRDFYSFNTQAIIADQRMFLYDQTNGLVEVTDPDLGQPIDGTWINGYYFLTDGESIYHTDLSDESSISALRYAAAEFMPDSILGVEKTQDNKVTVFGRYTIEQFVDQANDNFAFTRIESRSQKIGIVATHAKCELGGSFYITGGRRNTALSIYKLTVSSAEKIASKEIDEILASYTEAELFNMTMEVREERDSSFIQINLPYHTLLYNATVAPLFGTTYAWSILKTDVLGDKPYCGVNGIHDPVHNKWVYGDRSQSRLGVLNKEVPTQYDTKVEWILYSPFMKLEGMSIDEIEAFIIPGKNVNDDATVACSTTTEGWLWTPEFWMEYGSPLDYSNRFIARRLGYVRDKIAFKFRGVSTSNMTFSGFKVMYG